MWIFKKNSLNKSGAYEENFLFKKGKIYIMDNHRSAAWCWIQELDRKLTYNLFHIDRHYDLLENLNPKSVKSLRSQLISKNYTEYSSAQISGSSLPLVRFDNYILLYQHLFPKSIKERYFATHDDGTYPENIITYRPEIIDLPGQNISYWMIQDNDKWILNIDLDYFFSDDKSGHPFQFLTDEYIIKMCQDINECLHKIDVITIALSPDFCGGWLKSKRILEIMDRVLDFDFPFDEFEWQ
jgi:hypothetical protein